MGFLGDFNFSYREFFLDSLKAQGILSSYFLLWLFSLPSYGFLRLPCRLDLRVLLFAMKKILRPLNPSQFDEKDRREVKLNLTNKTWNSHTSNPLLFDP